MSKLSKLEAILTIRKSRYNHFDWCIWHTKKYDQGGCGYFFDYDFYEPWETRKEIVRKQIVKLEAMIREERDNPPIFPAHPPVIKEWTHDVIPYVPIPNTLKIKRLCDSIPSVTELLFAYRVLAGSKRRLPQDAQSNLHYIQDYMNALIEEIDYIKNYVINPEMKGNM